MPFKSRRQQIKSKSQMAAYIAAMVDGEGSISFGRGGRDGGKKSIIRRISIANTDMHLLLTCREMLMILEINCKIRKRSNKIYLANPKWNEAWDLTIYGRENFEKFLELIPIQSTKKIEALKCIVESYIDYFRPTKEQLYEDYIVNKLSYAEIGKKYKFKSVGSGNYWLKKYGITPRKYAETTAMEWNKGTYNHIRKGVS